MQERNFYNIQAIQSLEAHRQEISRICIIFTWITEYIAPNMRNTEGTRFSIVSSMKNFPVSSSNGKLAGFK